MKKLVPFLILSLTLFFSQSTFAQCPDQVSGVINPISVDGANCTISVTVDITSSGNSSSEIWITSTVGGLSTTFGDDGNCDFTSLNGTQSQVFGNFTVPCTATITIHYRGWTNPSCGGSSCSGFVEPIGNLPVDLVSFGGELMDKDKVRLTWTTASEENNDHFEIQHSTNGVDFRPLEQVQGNGTTDELRYYSFIHEAPARGHNYYRIKQVDYDGQYEIFEIIEVTVEELNDFVVYPSQTHGPLSLAAPEAASEDIIINIYNTSGLLMQTGTLAEGTFKVSFDVSDLPAGVYFIRYINSDLDYTTKQFIKLKM